MSVLIKDMDIQKSETTKIYNARIIACSNGEIWFELAQTLGNGAEASEMCECINIPTPHGRLIDADELMKECEKEPTFLAEMLHRKLRNAPTIIEAEE